MPKSRINENEIFITTFLKTLGFLVPKTKFIEVKFNNEMQKFIFQEKFNKEFLESYKLREGPIYLKTNLGDRIEKQIFKIENSNWIKNDFEKFISSSYGFEKLNNYFSIDQNNSKLLDTNNLLNNKNKILIDNYHAIMMSLNAFHGLGLRNQVFYYDIQKDFFIPIYNDGKSSIIQDKKVSDNKFFASLKAHSKINFQNNLILKLNKINKEKLLNDLKKNGLQISMKKLEKKLDIIEKRLNEINNVNFNKNDFNKKKENKDSASKLLYLANTQEKIFKICDYQLTECKYININNLNEINLSNDKNFLKNLLKQNLLKENYIYQGTSFDNRNNFRSFSNRIDFDSFTLYTNDHVKILIKDIENKVLKLQQAQEKGRALILGEKIDSWKISFEGKKTTKNSLNFNNLTGCLTLIDIQIDNSKIYSNYGNCEDSINFIRTKGRNNEVYISNAFSDGIDLDFSDISFKYVSVKNSKNDCMDFSGGNYKIYNATINYCGDKAISVGEMSSVEVIKSKLSRSEIGVASKDGSKTSLSNTIIDNVKFCLAAYKKKQEFSGGYIFADNLDCKDYKEKLKIDKFSKINENEF